MEVKNIATIIVGVIVACAVAIPVIGAATDSLYIKQGFDNMTEDYQTTLSPINESSSNTLDIASTGITTNNGTIAYWEDTTVANVMLICENIYVAAYGNGNISVVTADGVTSDVTRFTADISAGEITYSINSADVVTTTYTKGYVADPNGEYVSCQNTATKYFDDVKIAQCRYDSGLRVFIDGTGYNNGVEANVTVRSTPVADTDDQVKTLDGLYYTSSRALNSAVVMEKTAYYIHTEEPQLANMISIIPILIITGLIIGAISVFVRRE